MVTHATRINQEFLVRQLVSIFPNDRPTVNARKETNFKNTKENYFLELDVWFPKHQISFEFQDEYHYTTTWYSHSYLDLVKARDYKKKEIVKRRGVTLIEIPCWWDGDINRLKRVISFYRPDLIIDEEEGDAVSLNPPLNLFTRQGNLPGVGELMYAAFPALAGRIHLCDWWVGEKYDGIRFCWNPQSLSAYSRNSSEFSLLPALSSLFPSMFIDGEFWFGRGMFSLTSTLVNKDVDCVLWDQFRTVAFDNPSLETQQKTFEERYSLLLSIPVYHQFTIIASRMIIKPLLFEIFSQMIIEDEGEGIIARKRGSLYENGRSLSLLKFKKVSTDREGIVVDVHDSGVSLLVPEGVILTVLREDVFLSSIVIGDIVTFSYERAAKTDLPSQIKIHRQREDLSWEDVVENFHKDRHVADSSFKSTVWNNKTMRNFLEEFATEKGLDPFSEDTWYNLNTAELYQDTKGRAILRRFKGYIETIQKLFPEINFDVTLFTIPKWRDISNRKKFFERFAKKNGFDPLNPDAWYQHNNRQLFGKQIYGIEKYHKNSVAQALLDLFPDIGLDRISLQSAWNDRANRRMFFENYARANGFDPLDALAWQSQSISKIKSHKRVRSVLAYYGNNFSKALNDIFPEIGWKVTSYATWGEATKRRMFFEQYAKTNGFDPLVAENWYRLSRRQLKEIPGVRSLLFYHGHSIIRALQELFPDIGLVLSKWTRM